MNKRIYLCLAHMSGKEQMYMLNSTCKCNRILINNLLIIRTQKVAFIS